MLYVLRKIVEGFIILEENGITHRDVKPENIILAEDPMKKGSFLYKIADFGLSCQVPRYDSLIPVITLKGFTKAYVAPEVLNVAPEVLNIVRDGCLITDKYNPFLADVYSLGLVALNMIDNNLRKKMDLKVGLLSQKEKFKEYEPILKLLKGMLKKDPEKRWNFKKILKYFEDNENCHNFYKIPNDERFCQKWYEKMKKKTPEGIEKLYQEHKKMFKACNEEVHLERALKIVLKLAKMYFFIEEKSNDYERKIFKRIICYLKLLGLNLKCFFILKLKSFIGNL